MKTFHLWVAFNKNGYILGISVNKGALVKLFPNSNFKHVSFTNNSTLLHKDLVNI